MSVSNSGSGISSSDSGIRRNSAESVAYSKCEGEDGNECQRAIPDPESVPAIPESHGMDRYG